MENKRRIQVDYEGRIVTVAWYPGTGDAALEEALLSALGLPSGSSVVLRDGDGDVVALTSILPDGLKLSAEVRVVGQPTAPSLAGLQRIPGPRPYPLVGNIPDIGSPQKHWDRVEELFEAYGPFLQIKMPDEYLYFCQDADVVRDLLEREKEFPKLVEGQRNPLRNLREDTVGQGLFTADDTDEIWQMAHRILLPAFGARALKQYFPRVREVANDLVAHLAQRGPNTDVLVPDAMTRMTFEAIGYTAFTTRLRCIEATELPPFVLAMVDALNEAQRAMTAIIPLALRPRLRRRREQADALMRIVVDDLISKRRHALSMGEPVPADLLQIMLTTADPVTGKRLPDQNVRHQLITFLIAGHETTSGALSYALYYLSKHPRIEALLVDEVDRVFGRDFSYVPTFGDVEQLEFAGRILKETLRLNPTAPAFFKSILQDTVLAGKYAVRQGARVIVYLRALHRDPLYWGTTAAQFDPDRFVPEAVAKRHPNAYHPFGLGMRSCIGFQFALLEARLVLALLYQRFRPVASDPTYQLRHVSTLTIKPDGFRMRFEPRPEDPNVRPWAQRAQASAATERHESTRQSASTKADPTLRVLFGSNMGAAQDLAVEIARQAEGHGLKATVDEADAYPGTRHAGDLLAIVCSTYNGHPPDNAGGFATWLAQESSPIDGLRYAVLGCGNAQWRKTYQKFPRFVHQRLADLGGSPVCDRGECDADGDFEGAARAWVERFWTAVTPQIATSTRPKEPAVDRIYTVELSNYAGSHESACFAATSLIHASARWARVLVNEELQANGSERSTRHIEVSLPGVSGYVAGDHLGVFPENPPEIVEAVARRCGLKISDVLILHEREGASQSEANRLLTGVPLRVGDLLGKQLDLLGPITRRELQRLAKNAQCPPERERLEAMTAAETFRSAVSGEQLTIVDILEQFPSIDCDLELLASLRPAIKPRYYSISSSPRALPGSCSITVGVHHLVANGRSPEGLCSGYLAHCAAGAAIRALVKDTGSRFRLPVDAGQDVIMVAAGTGLSPMRGFLQERAYLRQEGTSVGRTFLFFGCRQPDEDFIYRIQLEKFLADGVLSGLYTGFSREPRTPKTYVQDRIIEKGEQVWTTVKGGGYVFVCGDSKRMAPDVGSAFEEVFARHGGLDAPQARAYREQLETDGRYLQDVWSNS